MEERKSESKPLIGITIGDINGIGPEVIIKAVSNQRIFDFMDLVLYGHAKVLIEYKKILDLKKLVFNQCNSANQVHSKKLNVINCWEEEVEINPGADEATGGKCALAALERATIDLKEGKLDAVVTAPINKHNIQSDLFDFPGHTEYYTSNFGAKESLMFLCNDLLRVGVATGHIALNKVSEVLTQELISDKVKLMLNSVKKDFGITKPKIAVLGLNPHAGEDGLLGDEEKNVISPAINSFKEKGELVFGPYPADGFFGNGSYKKFDAVLAMYHDQGLIPFKNIAFEDGVNFTAGLSIVRTSPDHGTAYNIAGKNVAHEQSMRSAIYMAKDIAQKRKDVG